MSTIIITVDALRADHLSQYGYRRNTMPVIDDWLANAIQVNPAIANGPHTAQSLPSLLTSQYVPGEAVEEGPTIATPLQKLGLTTAAFHSNTAISTRYDTVADFDHYEDFTTEMDEEKTDHTVPSSTRSRVYSKIVDSLGPIIGKVPGVRQLAVNIHNSIEPTENQHEFSVYVEAETFTNQLIQWIEAHSDEDFFLWAHYMDPHRPYGLHPDDPAFADEKPPKGELRRLMPKLANAPSDVTDSEWERAINLYDSDIKYVSEHLERLFETLEKAGIWDELNLILTSDHGEEFGEHENSFHRNRGYEELINVPLFIKAHDRSGSSIKGVRELIDIAPTIARFYDASPDQFQGKNIYSNTERTPIVTGSIHENDKSVAVRPGEHKYIYTWSGSDVQYELYDLSQDADESYSIQDEERAQKIHDMIPEQVLEEEFSFEVSADSEAARQRLEDLGYL